MTESTTCRKDPLSSHKRVLVAVRCDTHFEDNVCGGWCVHFKTTILCKGQKKGDFVPQEQTLLLM